MLHTGSRENPRIGDQLGVYLGLPSLLEKDKRYFSHVFVSKGSKEAGDGRIDRETALKRRSKRQTRLRGLQCQSAKVDFAFQNGVLTP